MTAVPRSNRVYWTRIRERALALHSDGCSYVTQFYEEVCWEHDIHYRTHATLYGGPITRAEADDLLRQGIRLRSPFGRWSPMAQWRWAAVRLFGGPAWRATERGSPLHEWSQPSRDIRF